MGDDIPQALIDMVQELIEHDDQIKESQREIKLTNDGVKKQIEVLKSRKCEVEEGIIQYLKAREEAEDDFDPKIVFNGGKLELKRTIRKSPMKKVNVHTILTQELGESECDRLLELIDGSLDIQEIEKLSRRKIAQKKNKK